MSGAIAASELSLTGSNLTYVILAAVIALVALGFAAGLVRTVLATGKGTQKMQEIAGAVQEGASAYLLRQFKTLGVFVIIAFVLLFLLPVNEGGLSVKIGRSVFFVVGAVFSAFIGGAGMALATRANLRVAAAANTGEGSRERAMQIAFRTGGVVGFLTVCLGLFGAAVVVLIYKGDAPTVLEGFGFGAALLAMFMRVGGGIFTKAADVGADLVGKVEQGIPEDDPRNAATIADNVGDNVGDCAGMAADLFESYAVTLVAALILGKAAFGEQGLVFPLIVPTIGVISAIVIADGVYGAFLLGGGSITLSLFAVALAGTGLLTTVGVIVAMDTFGPISDNAPGIAEMSGDIDEHGARVLTDLDAVGNTTKAITKGIAIATAVLAATALFGSYTGTVTTSLLKAGQKTTIDSILNVAN